MTAPEWDRFVAEVGERWPLERHEGKLRVLTRRFGGEPFGVAFAALEDLETTCEYFPSIAKWFAAFASAKGQLLKSQEALDAKPQPLTSFGWFGLATRLREEAELIQRPDSKARLRRLADFYDENGRRLQRGEERLWPPPPYFGTGAFGRIVDRAVTPREPDNFFDDSREDVA